MLALGEMWFYRHEERQACLCPTVGRLVGLFFASLFKAFQMYGCLIKVFLQDGIGVLEKTMDVNQKLGILLRGRASQVSNVPPLTTICGPTT